MELQKNDEIHGRAADNLQHYKRITIKFAIGISPDEREKQLLPDI